MMLPAIPRLDLGAPDHGGRLYTAVSADPGFPVRPWSQAGLAASHSRTASTARICARRDSQSPSAISTGVLQE
jgi:hypothetical protein